MAWVEGVAGAKGGVRADIWPALKTRAHGVYGWVDEKGAGLAQRELRACVAICSEEFGGQKRANLIQPTCSYLPLIVQPEGLTSSICQAGHNSASECAPV